MESINSITPLQVKFELRASGNACDVSDNISNRKNLEMTLKRDGTSGVFHEITFPFEFVLNAYDILKNLFDEKKYHAEADIYIYIRRDDWMWQPDKYHAPQIFSLDFTTYERTDAKIEIDTKRVSLYDHLKNKGKITYDIPVSEIKEQKPWRFDRIELENKIVFRVTSEKDQTVSISRESMNVAWRSITLGVTYEETEIGVQDVIYNQTVAYNKYPVIDADGRDESSYFMWLSKDSDYKYIDCNIDITGTVKRDIFDANAISFALVLESLEGDAVFDIMTYSPPVVGNSDVVSIEWRNSRKFLINKGGWGCYLLFRSTNVTQSFFNIDIEGTVTVRYNAKYKPIDIDIINPQTLLQNLVNRMTGTQDAYAVEIEEFNEDDQDLILMAAAESIRAIEPDNESEGAKVHTSYNSFLEWMNVFGYEEHVTADALTLKKRSKGFRSDLTAIELDEEECAKLKEYVNADYLYSGVKTGYQKKDIENANVRFEFNGQHDYSTNINLSDNILELISPYRADCYGIEFLAQEREKKTTDNKADKDMFLVHVKETENEYETVKSVFAGNVLTNIEDGTVNDTLFNGKLNPFNLLKPNEGLIGVSVDKLTFTASDANAEIVIDGQPVNADYDIPAGAGLFDPVMYDIASRNMRHLPEGERTNGVVRFNYKGAVYEGFIEEITKNPAWEAETTWKLYGKKTWPGATGNEG